MNIESPEKKFIDYRNAFNREIGWLSNLIKLNRHLREKGIDRLKEINMAPAFFRCVLYSFSNSIVIGTAKLCIKTSTNEFSIYKLLNFVEQNINLFSVEACQSRSGYPDNHWTIEKMSPISLEKINEDRDKFQGLHRPLESIKSHRDKIWAHNDKVYFIDPSTITGVAPLELDDFDEIQSVLIEIYNRYSLAFDWTTQEFVSVNIFDIDRILNILHEYREEERLKSLNEAEE